MPKIQIEKSCGHSPADTFSRLKKLFNEDTDLHKLDPGYECQFHDGALSGTAKGSKFKAEMTVKDKGGSSLVVLTVDLPLMLTPLKGMVESTLKKKLDHHLG